MKKSLCWMSVLVWLFAATAAVVFTGCEKDDDDDSASSGGLSITPASASLVATNTSTATFTASGGTPPYTWHLHNSCLGSIVSSGDTAIYTATAGTGTNFVTLTDSATNSVTATVTQN